MTAEAGVRIGDGGLVGLVHQLDGIGLVEGFDPFEMAGCTVAAGVGLKLRLS